MSSQDSLDKLTQNIIDEKPTHTFFNGSNFPLLMINQS